MSSTTAPSIQEKPRLTIVEEDSSVTKLEDDRWEQQRAWNRRLEDRFRSMEHRFSGLQIRVGWVALLFAALGAVLGGLLRRTL